MATSWITEGERELMSEQRGRIITCEWCGSASTLAAIISAHPGAMPCCSQGAETRKLYRAMTLKELVEALGANKITRHEPATGARGKRAK